METTANNVRSFLKGPQSLPQFPPPDGTIEHINSYSFLAFHVGLGERLTALKGLGKDSGATRSTRSTQKQLIEA